jgi:hypothetical protein
VPVARYAPHRASQLETAPKIIIIRGRTQAGPIVALKRTRPAGNRSGEK